MVLRSVLLAILTPLLLLEAAFAAPGQDVQIRPTDNPSALQARMSSLAPGSTLRLMPGLYAKGLRFSELRGTPQAPIRITAEAGANLEGWQDKKNKTFGNGSGILLEKSSNVVIEGLSISGFERGVTLGSCQGVTVKGNTIADVSNYGIMSYRSDGTVILENHIERSHAEHGIYISDGASKIVISKNIIRDTHVNGIHVNGAVVAPVITDNQFERTGSFPTKEGGAALTLIGGTTAPVVERNHFKNIYGQGITLDAPNAVISANTFEACAWSDILGLPRSMNLRLSDNVFKDTAVIPLQLNSVIIASVTASGNRFSAKEAVCQANESQRKYSLKDWQGMGKDVR